MYRALDICKYILSYYNDRDVYITNLKLQKLLYYIQLECLKNMGELCFPERIEAWRHGPVVPSVYYQYNSYLSQPIFFTDLNTVDIDEDYKKNIDKVLDEFENIDAWDMVAKTHSEYPWVCCYEENKNNEISVDTMKQFINTQKKNLINKTEE